MESELASGRRGSMRALAALVALCVSACAPPLREPLPRGGSKNKYKLSVKRPASPPSRRRERALPTDSAQNPEENAGVPARRIRRNRTSHLAPPHLAPRTSRLARFPKVDAKCTNLAPRTSHLAPPHLAPPHLAPRTQRVRVHSGEKIV